MIVKFLDRAEFPRPGSGGDARCLVSRGSSQLCSGTCPGTGHPSKQPAQGGCFNCPSSGTISVYSPFSGISVEILGKGGVCLFGLAGFCGVPALGGPKRGGCISGLVSRAPPPRHVQNEIVVPCSE